MGARRAIEVSCVAWLDLLGYGAQLSTCSFDPTSEQAEAVVGRLHRFHEAVASRASRNFSAFVLNDGAVVFRDLSPRTSEVTYEFLRHAVNLYEHVNSIENKEDQPGARMVIAAGFRIRSRAKPIPSGIGQAIIRRLQQGTITVDSAIREAIWARPVFGMVPELQANFALTKAFLADHGGSTAGLPGPKCYVDTTLFSTPLPSWINFSAIVHWTEQRLNLSADFGVLERLKGHGSTGHKGMLDAFQIAERLSDSHE
jgi:hypothetical protein